ncbi:acyltransferase family protein [Enterobacter sp. C4G1]|uniref:acyltransferase family protein n=1 Tax=Enterobacter sp. C4G1 TaxID=3458724 RepID=UPI00406783A0
MEISLYDLIGVFFAPVIIMCFVYAMSPKNIKVSLNADPGRYVNIEPLRGIAAALVAISHSFFSYNLTYHGSWQPINSKVADISEPVAHMIFSIGGVGVMLFFMITGFLFFDKAIKSDGMVDFRRFYIGRFFRIVPAYMVVAILILLIAFFTGYYHYNTPKEYILSGVSWLTFGLSTPLTVSAHIDKYLIIAGVLWTLNIEWKFYFLYPLICQFAKYKVALISLAAFFLVVCALAYLGFFDGNVGGIFLSFIAGGFAASSINWGGEAFCRIIRRNLFALTGVIICAVSLYFQLDVYSFLPWMGIFMLFLSISHGCSVLGVLNISPVRWLGAISYSLYLSHGVFLFLCNKILLNGYGYFVPATSAFSMAILFSVISYHFVEKIGVKLGRKISEGKQRHENIESKSSTSRSVSP